MTAVTATHAVDVDTDEEIDTDVEATDEETVRTCPRCKESYPADAEHFYWNKKTGALGYCRGEETNECNRALDAIYNAKRKARVAAKAAEAAGKRVSGSKVAKPKKAAKVKPATGSTAKKAAPVIDAAEAKRQAKNAAARARRAAKKAQVAA